MDSSGNESDLARRRDNRQRIVGDSDANVIVSASDDPKGSSNSSVGGSASQMSSLTDEDDNKRAAGAVALVVGDNKKKRDYVDDVEGDNESECSVQLPYKKRGRGRHMKHRHPEQQSHAKSEDGDDPLDLTTVSGQLSQNSHLTPEQAKMAAKREYNRRNAARARIRNKNLMTELQERCTRLTTTTEELERENEILRAQLEIFRGQGAIPGTARAAQRPKQQAASPTMSAQPPPPPPQPQRVPVFFVDCLAFGNVLRDSQSKLVGCLVVSHFYGRYHAVSLLESVWHPPGESGFMVDALSHGVFGHLDGIRLFYVGESLPRRRSVFPLDAKMPPFGGLPQVLFTCDGYVSIGVSDSMSVRFVVRNGLH